MKLYIASDHAGFELKTHLIESLTNSYSIIDLGCNNEESVDYPDFAFELSRKMTNKDNGILICGSGIGMSIAANRFKTIRAALCHNEEYAELAKNHNNSNVLVLGARFLNKKQSLLIAQKFLTSTFSLDKKHHRRVEKLFQHGE